MASADKPERYRTLAREGTYEFIEKKSRFVGYAAPALTEADALAYVESVRMRHPGCSAVLYAYVCGFSGQLQRFHDAHEPSGGLLILEALKRQAVTGAVAAVARYYGGVQLGAGPLGRAFGRAAAEAVTDASPGIVERSLLLEVSFGYGQSGGLEHWFQHSPYRLRGLEYGETIKATALVKAADEQAFLAAVADWTGGRAEPAVLSETYHKWEQEGD